MDAIKIGSGAAYRPIANAQGYGVWSKTLPSGKQTWIIGKVPEAKYFDAVPSSALAEFASCAEALAAVERWSSDRVPPKAPPKAKTKLGSLRRNGNRPRPEKVNPNQLGLPL